MTALARTWSWFTFGSEAGAESRADLIADLEDDHRELVRQYDRIETMATEGRFASIPAALSLFKARFDGHVHHEHLHCFGPLADQANGPEELGVIQGFRAEMDSIARALASFVHKYRMAGVRPSNGAQFLSELRYFGVHLRQRLQSEESELYPLYLA